ncbi:MAG: beta-ketoacyl-[acyl-carrier-protein] synthase family protein [Proteobacteria bacterium]|nr:beta-ketoacyl-[acyl-carrier-protein] synthase family protein [Pseudomonadota bacterium]
MTLYVADCGVVTPLGRGCAANAQALAAGRRALTYRDDLIPGRPVAVGAVAGELPPLPEALAGFDCRNNRLMRVALDEIARSVRDAAKRFGRERVAVVLGTSTSGMAEGETALGHLHATGSWPATYGYTRQEIGSLGEFAARYLDLAGPAYTVAAACASSAKVFASARRLIRAGIVDAAVVGGADTLCRMTLNGFDALEALSPGFCAPFAAGRDGINIGEGASAFLLSREAGPVRFLGAGETSDAHHVTAPAPDGNGATRAMRLALDDAGLEPSRIGYVNLHGTATRLNDAMESAAVAALFGEAVPCSSTKAMTGHMLGATGGCEAAFLWLTLNPAFRTGFLPPHVWGGTRDPALPALNFVASGTRLPEDRKQAMLSNSFGFGGSNVSLILGEA